MADAGYVDKPACWRPAAPPSHLSNDDGRPCPGGVFGYEESRTTRSGVVRHYSALTHYQMAENRRRSRTGHY